MRPIKRRDLVHECLYYRPSDASKDQELKFVKVDRASSIDMDRYGSVISGSASHDNMILIIDRVNSIYDHVEILEQDRIVFKGEEYSVIAVVEQTANVTDEVHHWEVLLT